MCPIVIEEDRISFSVVGFRAKCEGKVNNGPAHVQRSFGPERKKQRRYKRKTRPWQGSGGESSRRRKEEKRRKRKKKRERVLLFSFSSLFRFIVSLDIVEKREQKKKGKRKKQQKEEKER